MAYKKEKLKKILLIRFSSLGDVILISPVIKKLAKENFLVDIYTKEEYNDVFINNPFVNNIYTLSKDENIFFIIKNIRRNNYYKIIDLHKNLRTFIIKLFFPFKTISYKKFRFRRWLLVKFKINFLKNNFVIKNYLDTLRKIGINYKKRDFKYKIYYKKVEGIKHFPKKTIVLAPFSKWSTKEWPFYKELIRKIELPMIILGSKDEYNKAKKLIGRNKRVLNLCGKTFLGHIGSIIEKAELFITNDSGLMHYAAGMDIPIIAIFGSTTEEFGFYSVRKNVYILENNNLKCRPCAYHGRDNCPKGHFKCMREISVEEVENMVWKIIK